MIRTLDLKQKTFKGKSGTDYFIEDNLAVKRWRKYLKLQNKLGWGISFEELFEKVKQAFMLLDESKPRPVSAGTILYNIMERVKEVEDDSHVPEIIQMCALFMNTKDENREDITEQQIKEKMEDWSDISVQSFFLFALSTIPNFIPIYNSITQNTFRQPNPQKAENEVEEKSTN